ncbi:MAG: cytochrome c assembly protein, partial [SAR324 cluster bacterium]
MLIAGTWGALLLYIISWISGLFSSNLVQPSGSRFQVWTDVT